MPDMDRQASDRAAQVGPFSIIIIAISTITTRHDPAVINGPEGIHLVRRVFPAGGLGQGVAAAERVALSKSSAMTMPGPEGWAMWT
jgi:hypothetical protein